MCKSQTSCADPEGRQGVRTPLKILIGFLSNTGGPDPLKNQNLGTKPESNVGLSSVSVGQKPTRTKAH